MVVGLLPESTPNPQNRNIAHATTMISSDQETGLANCSAIKIRVCSISPMLRFAAASASFCAAVEGLSAAMEFCDGLVTVHGYFDP